MLFNRYCAAATFAASACRGYRQAGGSDDGTNNHPGNPAAEYIDLAAIAREKNLTPDAVRKGIFLQKASDLLDGTFFPGYTHTNLPERSSSHGAYVRL